MLHRPQVVWFKRDFRVQDHAPFLQAAAKGPVLPLVIIEAELWTEPDYSARHYAYLKACISDLRHDLHVLGGKLILKTGSAVDVFAALKDQIGTFDLWAHQETGNMWTFHRDQAVRAWCASESTAFTECLQFGVWRGSEFSRDGWSKRWNAMMGEAPHDCPAAVSFLSVDCEDLPSADSLGLAPDGLTDMQTPGRAAALSCLSSFLTDRGAPYRTAMSSPLEGETACSRLSAHLAYGSISMREVYQATQARLAEVKTWPRSEQAPWRGALVSFLGRLHWHCHFMQKLEREPELEYLPMARAYTGLRDDGRNAARLEAFASGQTGFPFVDACMRFLRAKGWINFRMRAMLQSFASYNLWLPWQDSGAVLARLFTDYEPGIHWPQTQMQSGVTGINTLRIYSVTKQGKDQDPDGVFTRRWVPELENLPIETLFEPWNAQEHLSYARPLVDLAASGADARQRIWAIRRTPEAKEEAQAVYERHGSRRRPRKRPSTKKPALKATGEVASP